MASFTTQFAISDGLWNLYNLHAIPTQSKIIVKPVRKMYRGLAKIEE